MYTSPLSHVPQPSLVSLSRTPEDRRPYASPGDPTCPGSQPSAPPLSHPRPDSTYIGRVPNRGNDRRNHKHEHNVDTDGLGRPSEVLVSVGLHVCATPVLAPRPSVFNSFPQSESQCRRVSVVRRARVRFFCRWGWEGGDVLASRTIAGSRAMSVWRVVRNRHHRHGGRAQLRRGGEVYEPTCLRPAIVDVGVTGATACDGWVLGVGAIDVVVVVELGRSFKQRCG